MDEYALMADIILMVLTQRFKYKQNTINTGSRRLILPCHLSCASAIMPRKAMQIERDKAAFCRCFTALTDRADALCRFNQINKKIISRQVD